MKLLAHTAKTYRKWLPNVRLVLSVLDEPYLERQRQPPLPLLSFMTSRGHWDIPVPSHAYFETSGGISSNKVKQDFAVWESPDWQRRTAAAHPWEGRGGRAFFRGHDWDSSNSFTELLPTRPEEDCLERSPWGDSTSRPFGYRRWLASQSEPGEPLAGELDVGLTGAPSFVEAQHPGRKYAAPVPMEDHARHKYLLHLDGTTASNRLLKLLMLGSVVLKQDSVYQEWFYRHLQPGVHFVAFERNRCSARNLTDTLAWLRQNDAAARPSRRRASGWRARCSRPAPRPAIGRGCWPSTAPCRPSTPARLCASPTTPSSRGSSRTRGARTSCGPDFGIAPG
ncbi:unnamed protein product [Prorocentrum cordatum]|uniref:Glycosyl transferase CAP10 domain-containing protein n=1 Tax=Prorocentrum cordatum TaxID=2364126 RepID=A0ABN9XQI8_9DINO|nr:unnamed protein product [Polarella glacialis]